jgi:hypothetical protein
MSRYDLVTNRVSPKAGPVKEEYIIPENPYLEVSLSISDFEYMHLAPLAQPYIEEKLYRELCRKIGWPIAKEAVKFTQKRMTEYMGVTFSAWIKKEI